MSAVAQRTHTEQLQARRLIAAWVPDWPVTAAINEGLAGAHQPVALYDGRGIAALSAQARTFGVRQGMRRRSAQALCPQLVLLGVDEGRDLRAFEPVVQALEGVVPQVTALRPGLVLTGARGPVGYLGSEEEVASRFIGAAAAADAEIQVGVADGLLAAVLAARAEVMVPPGASAGFLARRDVRELIHATSTRAARAQMGEFTSVLRRLGVHTLGEFARLPASRVLSRFGALGQQAHRLARGLDAAPAAGARPEPDLTSAIDLDPPVQRLDVATFAARRLAEDLHRQMLHRGVLCGVLRVSARTSDGDTLTRIWRVEGALSASELTDRVRWQLEGWLSGRSGRRPSAPLNHLALVGEEVSSAAAVQEGLWGRGDRGERQAGRAALRVQGVLGPEGVYSPVAEGGRSPRERIRLVTWGDEATALRDPDSPWPGQIPQPLPSRIPAEPIPVGLLDAAGDEIEVDARGMLSGRPYRITPRTAGGRPVRVTGWAGPWPVQDKWWDGVPVRQYLQVTGVQVTGAEGALLLVGDRQGWRVEGVYE